MTRAYKFCELKVQIIDLVASDLEVKDNSRHVMMMLLSKFCAHNTGDCHVSFGKIASAIGKTPRSVRNAINRPGFAKYFHVQRGTKPGKASEFKVRDHVLQRAAEMRDKGGNSLPQPEHKWGKKLSQNGVKSLTPKKDQENKTHAHDVDPHLSEAEAERVFVEKNSFACGQWNEAFQKVFDQRIERVLRMSEANGKIGFWLPSKFPPTLESDLAQLAEKIRALPEFQATKPHS